MTRTPSAPPDTPPGAGTAAPGTILVNDQPMPWRAGLTVADILRERRFVFPLLVVSIDGRHVPRDEFAATTVPDGSTVVVVHLMSGG